MTRVWREYGAEYGAVGMANGDRAPWCAILAPLYPLSGGINGAPEYGAPWRSVRSLSSMARSMARVWRT